MLQLVYAEVSCKYWTCGKWFLLDLKNISGRKAYMKHLDNIYKQNDVSWFTPVELFKVFYIVLVLVHIIF